MAGGNRAIVKRLFTASTDAVELCEALGLKAADVASITLTLRAGDIARLTVELVPEVEKVHAIVRKVGVKITFEEVSREKVPIETGSRS